jgi:hypothetical protein
MDDREEDEEQALVGRILEARPDEELPEGFAERVLKRLDEGTAKPTASRRRRRITALASGTPGKPGR